MATDVHPTAQIFRRVYEDLPADEAAFLLEAQLEYSRITERVTRLAAERGLDVTDPLIFNSILCDALYLLNASSPFSDMTPVEFNIVAAFVMPSWYWRDREEALKEKVA